MDIKKNEEYVVDIMDNGIDGEGIAKINDYTIFVPQTTKGEKVRVLIVKANKNFAFAKVIEVIEKSENRIDEDCATYKRCGGCSLRFLDYEETLNIKEQTVRNCIRKEVKRDIKINKAIGMGNPYNYRNKLQYPLGIDKNGEPVMGVYAKRSHEIIPVQKCHIQNELSDKIAKDAFEYMKMRNITMYDEKKQTGVMRHIVIRIGVITNEVMLILVLNSKEFKQEAEFAEYITSRYPEIKTVVLNYNMKDTNVILGTENKTIYGQGYIYDVLGDYKFKISPLSFYQVNPIQTEVLYNKALEYAKLTGKETILDLYCGIGTIGIFASKQAKKVFGIEIIVNAVNDAKENAKINGIENAEFFCGEVENVLPEIIEQYGIKPEVVFVDPPRKGLDVKTIETILGLQPEKIVYISCNPATLARDIAMLEETYETKEITPVDMFPFTRSYRSGHGTKFKIIDEMLMYQMSYGILKNKKTKKSIKTIKISQN